MWRKDGRPDYCYFIAEIGVNHNGDIGLAERLIDVAVDAGADAVKFQTFFADQLTTRAARKAEYQKNNTGTNESQFEMLRKLELKPEDFRHLKAYCEARGIQFISTPFGIEAANLLAEIGVDGFKVSSGDLTYVQFLRHLASFGKPVILSTGMGTLEEVDQAMDALGALAEDKVSVLHCVSNYPASAAECNLRAMVTLRDRYRRATGWSDHTEGGAITLASVAMGAEIIEKHFTLDRAMPGPDHKASLEPSELKLLIRQIRDIEAALGNGEKIPSANERITAQVARRSVVAATDLAAGHRLTHADFAFLRPGEGLSPAEADRLVGRRLARGLQQGEYVMWQDLTQE